MSLISGFLDKYGIKASLAQCDNMEKWLVEDLWDKYNDFRMNKRIVIENEIRALGLRLPNGTVKKDYTGSFDIPYTKVQDFWLNGLEELGLASYTDDKGTCIVKGKPTKAGDFNVQLEYKPTGWIDGEPTSVLDIPIAFNPDPRSLWKEIPTSKDIPFYKEDYSCDYVKVETGKDGVPRKDIVAASKRGRSHAQEGKPRDDHFQISYCKDSEWYIIVVADGAGSAKYSRKGSAIACKTVTDYCTKELSDCKDFEDKIKAYHDADGEEEESAARKVMGNEIYGIVGNAAFMAHKAINEAAKANEKELGCKPKDFSTTLLFAICKKFDFGWFVASFWVGDGAMCIYNEHNKTAKLLGVPDEGEFSGQTRFLTMPDIFQDSTALYKRLRFSIEEDFTALMLMTDGVSDPMFETECNLNDYSKWNEFWNRIKAGFPEDEIPGVDLSDDNSESQYQLLKWMDFWSSGNHDDRTMAILY